MGASIAAKNRAVRKEALREQLAAKGLLQHVIEISEKLSDLDTQLEPSEVTRLGKAAELQLSLVKKYLPDLKAVEHSGPEGGVMQVVVSTGIQRDG